MSTVVSLFGELKEYVEQIVPLDRDYLHILVGAGLLALYLAWKAARGRPFWGREVVGLVFGIAVAAEIFDLWHAIARNGEPDIAESLKDIGLTLAVPLAAWIGRPVLGAAFARWRRG
jgi:hypothetical protein